MKKIIIALLCSLLQAVTPCFAQVKGDYIWTLGDGLYDGPGDEYSGMLLDFHTVPPSIIPTSIPMNEPLAFICDSTGQLALYTNGCVIANSSHEVVENGDSLNPGFWFGQFCEVASYSTYQGTLFLQQPGHTERYYLFHIKYDDATSWPNDLLYTLTDMSYNGGHGKVLLKNQVIEHERFSLYITAVRHGNGRDWWVVAPRLYTNTYTTLLLTPEGIEGPFAQSIGDSMSSSLCCGQTAFSADGSKYFKFLPKGGLQILDFDRCSGQFSNPLFIPYGADTVGLGGVVGSPNSRYLYLSTGHYMYQYDLQSSNIPASRQTVGVFDGYADPFFARFYQGARGPDGKLYFISSSGVKVMHVIHQPDEPGLACDFEQHGIHLPAYQSFFMPNFANYRLYDLPGSACDTLGIDGPVVSTAAPTLEQRGEMRVVPNPTSGLFTLTLPSGTRDALLQVFHTSGALILERTLNSDAAVTLDLAQQPAGMYAVRLLDRETGVRKAVKIAVLR